MFYGKKAGNASVALSVADIQRNGFSARLGSRALLLRRRFAKRRSIPEQDIEGHRRMHLRAIASVLMLHPEMLQHQLPLQLSHLYASLPENHEALSTHLTTNIISHHRFLTDHTHKDILANPCTKRTINFPKGT